MSLEKEKVSCTIIGSFSDIDLIVKIRETIKEAGYHIIAPTKEFFELKTHAIVQHHGEERHSESKWFVQRKALSIKNYFEYVAKADFIYLVNEKNGEEYYGLNSSMEVGIALYLGKPVVLHRPTTRAELKGLTMPCEFIDIK